MSCCTLNKNKGFLITNILYGAPCRMSQTGYFSFDSKSFFFFNHCEMFSPEISTSPNQQIPPVWCVNLISNLYHSAPTNPSLWSAVWHQHMESGSSEVKKKQFDIRVPSYLWLLNAMRTSFCPHRGELQLFLFPAGLLLSLSKCVQSDHGCQRVMLSISFTFFWITFDYTWDKVNGNLLRFTGELSHRGMPCTF